MHHPACLFIADLLFAFAAGLLEQLSNLQTNILYFDSFVPFPLNEFSASPQGMEFQSPMNTILFSIVGTLSYFVVFIIFLLTAFHFFKSICSASLLFLL